MDGSQRRNSAVILISAFVLASCSGGGGGPSSVPTATSPMVVSPNLAAPQARHRGHKHPLDATVCTKTPVMNLQVTPTSLTIAPNGSASFTACTQYATTYSLKVAPKGFVSVPASVTPTTQATTIKAATISVTAGSTCGSGTITVTDKKNDKQIVSV